MPTNSHNLLYRLYDEHTREATIFELYSEHRAKGAAARLALAFIKQLEVFLDYCDAGRPRPVCAAQIRRMGEAFREHRCFDSTLALLEESFGIRPTEERGAQQ